MNSNGEYNGARSQNPMMTLRCSRFGLIAGIMGVVGVAAGLSGCDPESCDQIEGHYQTALDSEPGLVELDDERPPHAAIAVDLDRLNDWTAPVIEGIFTEVLTLSGGFQVEGESVQYSLDMTQLDLQLGASDACEACLRVTGDLDGDAGVNLPMLGDQSTPLAGSLDWAVPLSVGMDEGDAAVFFDTEEAVRMNTPAVEAQLTALDDQWAGPVAAELASELGDIIADHVDPIRLFGYEPPSFGIEGFELVPNLLAFDEASNSVVLGVRTNLGVEVPREQGDQMVEAMALHDGSAAAVGVNPRVVVEGVRLALDQGDVPRRYTMSGRADEGGSGHAVVDDLSAESHSTVADALQLGLNFRVFNFGNPIACFSARGETLSRLAVDEGTVELELEDVEFSGGGPLTDMANWGSAQFVDHADTLMQETLDDAVLSIPGVEVDLLPETVSTEAGMITLRTSGD